MRNRIAYFILTFIIPMCGYAQVDDMYFVPKKETKAESKRAVTAKTVEESREESPVRYNYSGNEVSGRAVDVDEYNRRNRYYEMQPADTAQVAEEDEESSWREEDRNSDSDYAYSKRLLRFNSPTVGIAVSSPLYWDLRYGPASLYWDVYDDGFYAYAYPTVWNSWYYGPHYSWSWGWRPYYSYWGWGNPWYGGWHGPWYGNHWHHHHWWGGGHPGGGSSRPVSRPSVRYRENSALARGGTRTGTTNRMPGRTRTTRTTTTDRSNPTRTTRSGVTTNRNANMPTRSYPAGTTRRSSTSSYSRPSGQPSRNSFSGSGSMPSRSGGGFSSSRSGGGASRGRR